MSIDKSKLCIHFKKKSPEYNISLQPIYNVYNVLTTRYIHFNFNKRVISCIPYNETMRKCVQEWE